MSDKPTLTDSVVRGIIVGGSIGAIAGWFFMDIGRAIGLGLIMGFLAGLTHARLTSKRKRR